MKHLLKSKLILILALLFTVACAQATTSEDCKVCRSATVKAQELRGFSKKHKLGTEASMDKKTSDLQLKAIDSAHEFISKVLKENSISDEAILKAVFEVWAEVVNYDSPYAIGIKNFESFKTELPKVYLKLAQMIASESDPDKKQKLEAIQLSLAMAEDEASGASQDQED